MAIHDLSPEEVRGMVLEMAAQMVPDEIIAFRTGYGIEIVKSVREAAEGEISTMELAKNRIRTGLALSSDPRILAMCLREAKFYDSDLRKPENDLIGLLMHARGQCDHDTCEHCHH